MKTDRPNPADLGYRWPAEWEPHAATWLAWPHNRQTWPADLERVEAVCARLVRVLARHETVHILAAGAAGCRARAAVGRLAHVQLHDVPTNDAWIRDHGPMFLKAPPGGGPALVDWQYNAWGGKYPPYELDNDVPRRVAEITGRRRIESPIVLECGAIDGNGRGTILAAETCLLDPRRNPHVSRAALEHHLGGMCGARHIVWLAGELAGDDTDGHVDQTARFVDPRTVVAAVEEQEADANCAPLRDNLHRLETAVDQDGQPLAVVRLPMPRPTYYAGNRLPASYCNFYIANGTLVVPQFDDPADDTALELLAGLFPDRRVLALPAIEVVRGLGAFHCMTQQEPAHPDANS